MKLTPHCPIKYGFNGGSTPPAAAVAQQDQDKGNGTFLPSFDNRLWMFHRKWEPSDNEVKATLMILHGTVDHSGVYDELGLKLAASGIAVFAMDLRGWGLSDGESMYMNDMDTYCQDVENLYQYVHKQEKYANVKSRFLLGKSIGGLIAAYCVRQYPNNWTGMIGLSGAYELDPKVGSASMVTKAILYGLAMVAPKLSFKPLFDSKLLVSDPDALQAFHDDNLCCKDNLRVGYLYEFLRKLEELKSDNDFQKLNIPMLMMCGDHDEVVTVSGHEMMIDRCVSEDKTFKKYQGGLHNILQEPSIKDQVISDIMEWIQAHSS